MSWWNPFAAQPERRESMPFTDAFVSAIAAQSGGEIASASATAAIEAAAGLVSRVFSTATVTAPTWAMDAVNGDFLALVARDLLRRGESLHLIEVEENCVQLLPLGSWDIRGGPSPATWVYRGDLFGPSGNVTRFVSGAQIVHARYAVDPARPYIGISPIGWARLTGRLHAELETALGDEASGTRGHVITLPDDPAAPDDENDTDPLAGLKATIAGLRGRTALVETTAGNWGADRMDRPREDFKPTRIGASPPDALATLRSDSGQAILAALGCPIALFDDSTGTGKREAWRQFYASTIKPLARIIERECSAKLGGRVSLGFDDAAFEDRIGRANIATRLAGIDGVDAERALELAGLV